MKTITIEIPDGHELIKENDTYRLVATSWPQKGDDYEYIFYQGNVLTETYNESSFDVALKENGNCFEPGTARNSALYEVMNGEYYYWWQRLPVPSKVPNSLEYSTIAGWEKGTIFSCTVLHRWLKKEGTCL